MSNPTIIIWKAHLSVGITAIDEDHKNLIKMINRLFGSVLSSDPKQVLMSVLHDLLDYVVIHFQREEEYMRHHNYPGFEQHKSEHDALLTTATQFRNKLDSGVATDLKDEIENTLRDWLVSHIQGYDKELGTFLLTKGIS